MKYICIGMAALTLTSACGDGSSSARSSSGSSPFVSFSAAAAKDGTYRADGQAIVANYTTDSGGTVTTAGTPQTYEDITALMTYQSGVLTGVQIETSDGKLRFSTAKGDSFDLTTVAGAVVATTASGDKVLIAADPFQLDYEYQTFGTWQTGLTGTSRSMGAGTVGARTSESQMPSSGTASYYGDSLGQVITDGEVAVTTSYIAVDTNFDAVEIYSSDTVTADPTTGAIIGAREELDFYAAGSVGGTGFSANFDTGTLAGSVDGQFYGGNAQEVGGTFSGSTADSTYIGAFGAVDDTR